MEDIMSYPKTLKGKIKYRITRSKDFVFLIKDFLDLSGRDQVLRSLRALIKEEFLVKVGYGIYVKGDISGITGKIIPVKDMRTVAISALKKLGIPTCITPAERDYNEYKSTQVPNGFIIGVTKPVTRKISFGKIVIRYELVNEKTGESNLLKKTR